MWVALSKPHEREFPVGLNAKNQFSCRNGCREGRHGQDGWMDNLIDGGAKESRSLQT